MPKVSVLMPVYNAKPDEFRQAIESVLNQTFNDFEFLIINDGSTNGCEKILDEYNDDRIRYFENESNIKLIATLNRGLDLAQGEYVARLDADDMSTPNRLEKEVQYLDDNKNIGVVGSYFLRIPQNVVVKVPTEPCDVKLYIRYCQNCIIHSSVMLRKSVLNENNLRYDKNCLHAEDHKLWSDMSRFCDLAVIPEVLTHYRISPDGISENNLAWQRKMVSVVLMDNMIKDFPCNKNYLYSILVKYLKNEPVTPEEYNAIGYHLASVAEYVTTHVSAPHNMYVKSFILSILKWFVR